MMVHPNGKVVGKEQVLTEWLSANYPEVAGVGGDLIVSGGNRFPRNGVLHRLDRETSGVILIARNQKAFDFFQKQFLDREIKKKYRAVVFGEPKTDAGTIDLAIGRSRRDFRKWATGKEARGTMRQALTRFRKIISNEKFSLLELEPETGRTHQIRVHLSAIGNPIVGDKLYSPKESCALGFKRLALHAESVSLKLPNGRLINIKAPFPNDFQNAIEQIAVKI